MWKYPPSNLMMMQNLQNIECDCAQLWNMIHICGLRAALTLNFLSQSMTQYLLLCFAVLGKPSFKKRIVCGKNLLKCWPPPLSILSNLSESKTLIELRYVAEIQAWICTNARLSPIFRRSSISGTSPSKLVTHSIFLQITLVSHLDRNYCNVNADEDLVSLASLKRSSPMWQTLSGYGTPPTI